MPPDYSGQNLRGCSFKGQNLTRANFSGADIRGANFTNAILKNADFRGAKAGLQRRWTICLVMISLIISIVSGFPSFFTAFFAAYFLASENIKQFTVVPSMAFFILLAVFFIAFLTRQGFKAVAGAVAVVAGGVTAGVAAVAAVVAAVAAGAAAATGAAAVAAAAAVTGAAAGATAVAGAGAVAVGGATAVAAVTGTAAGVAAVEGATIVAAVGGAAAGVVTGATAGVIVTGTAAGASAWTGAWIVAVAVTGIGIYMAWRALTGDEKYVFVRNLAVAITAIGGTSFRNADLTDADFTGATFKNTDLRKANLTRTRFYEAKKLDFARVGDSILAKRDVLNLLVSGNGRRKSYLGANFKGANLIGADLKEANLKNADITEATFQGACLEWANLTLTQAVSTDFTSAQMTGACVEAWNIESTTKLDNVDCRFIYLLENPKPGTDDRERRPSSGEFKLEEFTKIFKEVLNTVDLIFRDGIDWKAFVAAFKKVQVENEDKELAIQSIENKGDGVVVVKVAVPVDANKEKIHSDFTQNYQLALQAVEEKYKAQLQAKEEQIVIYRQQGAEMKEIVSLLANKPINVYNNQENQNMTNSNDSSRKIEIGSVGGDFNASGQALNLGDISGTVKNTINELPASPEPEKPEIKELLMQLQTAIEAEENLTPKSKEKALKQVKALAEASQNPNDEEKQDLADTAITMLKGLISGLPTAATLVEACSNLLPMISKFLGIG